MKDHLVKGDSIDFCRALGVCISGGIIPKSNAFQTLKLVLIICIVSVERGFYFNSASLKKQIVEKFGPGPDIQTYLYSFRSKSFTIFRANFFFI